jgi:hypothetical protein
MGYRIRGVGGDSVNRRRQATVSYTVVGKTGGGGLGEVSWFGGGRTVVGDVEQLTVKEAAGGPALASLAVGPSLERMLHEGITADRILHSDDD